MTGEERKRAAALMLLMYVLETDWGLPPSEGVVVDIITELWCLRSGVGYTPRSGSFTDISTTELIHSLLVGSDETKLERAYFLLCTTRELVCENQPVRG